MNARKLGFALLGCALLSTQLLVGQGNPAMKANTVHASELLSAKFEKVKDGMSEKALLRLMGAPQHKEGDTWSYFENRAPLPGEQLMIYQILLRDHKVASKRIVPGPDATGPGQ